MILNLDEAVKELWELINSSKTSSKEKTKSIGLILTITKARLSILEKKRKLACLDQKYTRI
jgi:hypothetical protein